MNQVGTYRLRVGTLDCLVIKDGTPSNDPIEQFMEDVPAELAGKRLAMCAGLLIIDTPSGRVAIDSGNGPLRGERTFAAEAALAAEGINPASINTVLLTHGDFDHIGGLVREDGSLTYPNARYALHQELWDFWHNKAAWEPYPEEAKRLSGMIIPTLIPAIEQRGTLFDAEREVLPHVRAVPALGHRHGHTLYMVESEGQKLLHVGDAAVHPVFLEHPGRLNIRHDTDREKAADSRRMLSALAVAEGAMVIGTHFELPGVGTLSEIGEDRYTWTPVPAA